jgi:hypothetical protein
MRVAGILQVPTKRSKDILQQAKGITLIESIQIRWFSRWSAGGGWSGRAEAQRRPRVSKLRAKGLSDYHWCLPRAFETAYGALEFRGCILTENTSSSGFSNGPHHHDRLAVLNEILDSARLIAIFTGAEPTGQPGAFCKQKSRRHLTPAWPPYVCASPSKWDQLAAEYIHKNCRSFGHHLKAAVAKNGAFIE